MCTSAACTLNRKLNYRLLWAAPLPLYEFITVPTPFQQKTKGKRTLEQNYDSQCRNPHETVAGTPSPTAMRLLFHIALACRFHTPTFHT